MVCESCNTSARHGEPKAETGEEGLPVRRGRYFYWLPYAAVTILLLAITAGWRVLPNATAAAAAWRTSRASGPLEGVPVKNFGVVDEGILYRSGQPRVIVLPWLRHFGIASIVNLRESQYTDGELILSLLGFRAYLHLPMDNHAEPTEAEAAAFLKFVQDKRHWPILVHCGEGEGRTGVFVALARYAIDGWSLDRALAEANAYNAPKPALSHIQHEWLERWARSHSPGDYHPH